MAEVTFSDFTQNASTSGIALSPTATGTYKMAPHTSTKATVVAALKPGSTNQFSLASVGGNDSAHVVEGIDIGPFELLGTDQDHLYNGLRCGYSLGAFLHDIVVNRIPGNASGPPGETFSLNCWHATGATLDRIEAFGSGVGATLIGLNSCTNILLTNSRANGAVYGFGLACWKCENVRVIDFDATANRKALNFEQCVGTILLDRVDMRGQTSSGPNAAINSNLGSAKVKINDPKVDSWPLRVGVSSQPYLGKPQLQKVSDVHLVVDGKDVSADPKFLACGDVW